MEDQREKEIQALCKAVLESDTEFWDNPNGAYENSCPFCCAIEHRVGRNKHASISEIKHDGDCAYLIAKDLSTK